jgi:hypothetical protein
MRAFDDNTRVIGFFAFLPPRDVFRHGDACVVAGSEEAMRRYLEFMPAETVGKIQITKSRFGDVKEGMEGGASYAFDQEAYDRFYPLAQKAGIDVQPDEFRTSDDNELHLVKVKLENPVQH